MASSASAFRVLVTGGQGFVGRHLISALAKSESVGEILVGSFEGEPVEVCSKARAIAFDVTDADLVRKLIARERPTHLVHLAAIAAVAAAQHNTRDAWRINVEGALNVMLAVTELSAETRVLHVSSAEVYGASFRAGYPLDEAAPLEPVTVYGATKAAADLMVGQMARQNLRAIRLRPFNHIGPGQAAGFVVPDFAAQIARIERGEQPPEIRVGNLSSARDFLDVRDVVEAYRQAVLRFDALPAGCAINIASGRAIAIADILSTLVSLARVKIDIVQNVALMRPVDTPVIVGNPARAHELLGWAPQHEIRATLASVLEHCRRR
jgi:GDP-4-dehydro-6-deoxy-D-mannose reductase